MKKNSNFTVYLQYYVDAILLKQMVCSMILSHYLHEESVKMLYIIYASISDISES